MDAKIKISKQIIDSSNKKQIVDNFAKIKCDTINNVIAKTNENILILFFRVKEIKIFSFNF